MREVDETVWHDAAPLRQIADAFADRVAAERRVAEAVADARAAECSWSAISATLGCPSKPQPSATAEVVGPNGHPRNAEARRSGPRTQPPKRLGGST